MKKIGFIGSGNMASAIISGIIQSSNIPSGNIYVYDINQEVLLSIKEKFMVQTTSSLNDVVQESDIIFLSVKPYIIKDVATSINKLVVDDKIFISIAAGISVETLDNYFEKTSKVVRIMPNMGALVKESATSLCMHSSLTDAEKEDVRYVLNSFGSVYEIEESKFDVFTALCGSSPAFLCLYMDTLKNIGLEHQLPQEDISKMITQTVLGTAKLLKETNVDPHDMIYKIATKGGTTIEGIQSLENTQFIQDITTAVQKTMDRSNEMKKGKLK